MLDVTNAIGFGAVNIVPSASFLGNDGSATDLTTYNFTINPGIESSDRVVVVTVSSGRAGSANLSSATIAGSVGAVSVLNALGNNVGAHLAYARVPSGVSGVALSLTFAATMARCAIAVYSLYGVINPTPSSSNSPSGGGSASRSVTLDFAPNSVGIIAAGSDVLSTNWTNATEDFDGALVESSQCVSTAQYVALEAISARVISNSNCRAIVGAVWT